MYSRLDTSQNDWVEAKVIKDFELSKDVNHTLLKGSRVAPIPEVDKVIRTIQNKLADKKTAVDFMISAEGDESTAFRYQTKLFPGSGIDRVERARNLLIGRQKSSWVQLDELRGGYFEPWVTYDIEKYLNSREPYKKRSFWVGEFHQGGGNAST